MPLLGLDDYFIQVGHPHYTTRPDGIPKIMFTTFRDTWSVSPKTNKEGYTHEIWAVNISEEVFDPNSYRELKGVFQGVESKWYYGKGGRDLLIYSIQNGKVYGKISFDDEPFEVSEIKKGFNVIHNPLSWFKIILNAQGRASIALRF